MPTLYANPAALFHEVPPQRKKMGKSRHAATMQVVTPERLNRGSSPKCTGFPLKACGNDGPQKRRNATPKKEG